MPRRPSRHPHDRPTSRPAAGGRHELGQNFLRHRPTVDRFSGLVAATSGSILEIGAGDGTLTRALATLDRPLTAIEIDERRADRLRRTLPGVRVEHADALRVPLDTDVVAGNVPFHLTTPILRRLLAAGSWRSAVLLTQWEVARKRAGVGGGTMLTAQGAPWFEVALEFRVPARHFSPVPSVDGGVLSIERRERPLVPHGQRRGYERFVRSVFTGPGGRLDRVVERATGASRRAGQRALSDAGIPLSALPRALGPHQWAALWRAVRR